MSLRLLKSECSGCTACQAICPHDAINMVPDSLGFKYPYINTENCINCGLCEKVCAFSEDYDKSLNLDSPEAYASRYKDINHILTSQSGAAFVAISDYILERDGVVYGVGYDQHFYVLHKRATNYEQRDEFKGSKYVQSDLTGIFKSVKEDLKQGKNVLFTGTPCQTAGLHSYIGRKHRSNLLLCDIVCHGVPGPNLWRDYIAYLEKKHKKRIIKVNFRDKDWGWSSHKESFLFDGENFKRTYRFLFYTNLGLRYSCTECKYTNLQRPSDITISDFWGYENSIPDFSVDNTGISLMIINTEKGKDVFEKIKHKMHTVKVDLNCCMQPNLISPTKIHPKRKEFEALYVKEGFEVAMRTFGNLGWWSYFKRYFDAAKRILIHFKH